MWAEGKTFIFRTAIFVGLASVVTTIIYFTPIPGQDFISCERPCHELEMPMICRLKLTLEPYQTLSRECFGCPQNKTDCSRKHCVSADGLTRGILTANRQLPGPNIHVCENDILVVDVINRIPGHEVTVHWRGQPVKETPFMDGVAMVTQCPIPSAATFQYKFRASRAGTHLWHAHTAHENSGVFGALVVRQSTSENPDLDLYDVDDVDHVILVNTWQDAQPRRVSSVDALLVNGRSQVKTGNGEFPPTVFTVIPGKRHRFRLANAGGKGIICPISVSVDDHVVRVIALDGSPIVPRNAHSITLNAGERADFILHANQRNSTYHLRASTSATCTSSSAIPLTAVALVRYDAADVTESTPTADDSNAASERVHLSTVVSGSCDEKGGHVCVGRLTGTQMMAEELRGETLDLVIYLAFGYKKMVAKDTLRTSTWYDSEKVPYVNNLTFVYPSSPLLTQPSDVNSNAICNSERIPSHCNNGYLCECVHVVDIPLDSTVELMLVDEGGSDGDHTFHLHGHSFHLVGISQLADHLTSSEAKTLDQQRKLLDRNLINPVIKDTLTVPSRGVAALRFKADNPGFWLLDNDRSTSLNIVFRVGQSGDTPTTPEYFPTCGSWIGPDFFLI